MPGKRKPPLKALSNLEHELMKILWTSGAATAENIRESLAPRHVLQDSTVRTILKRLHDKGYVTYRLEGKAYLYSGAEKPRNVAVEAIRKILDRFCDGSLEQLLVGMVENEIIDRAELQQLARKLSRSPKAKGE
jgi:predicted transcriptional regulator